MTNLQGSTQDTNTNKAANIKGRKVMTDAQRQAAKDKREKNPSFGKKMTETRNAISFMNRSDFRRLLLSTKNDFKSLDTMVTIDEKMENEALIAKCKTFINYALKQSEKNVKVLHLFEQLQNKNKKGLFVQSYVENAAQNVVKYGIEKGTNYEESLNALIAKKAAKDAKKAKV